MKISFGLLPDHPMDEILDAIEVADKLGFHAVYGADETFHKDTFQIFAAAAHRTKHHPRARRHARDPARSDDGRAGDGDPRRDHRRAHRAELLDRQLRDARAVRAAGHGEALAVAPARGARVMRTFLDEGVLDHEGEFYTCTGMFTSARPVQERMPIKIGAMRGPKSFEFAGEVPTACTRRSATPARRTSTPPTTSASAPSGPAATGRRSTSPPGASPAWPRTGTRRASASGCWSRSTSRRCRSSRCSGTASRAQTQPIFDAFASGDVEKAIELTTPDLVEKLSFSGTPEDVVAQIKRERRADRHEPRHPLALRPDPGGALAAAGRSRLRRRRGT